MAFIANRYNSEAFETGLWEEFKGGRFKIGYIKNTAYRDALARLEAKARRHTGGEALTAEQQDEIVAEAMAIGLLTDWAEVEADEAGKPVEVPYSIESAKALLLADPELVAFVRERAANLERFERNRDDDAA